MPSDANDQALAQIESIRQCEVQALFAGLSRRDWHATETAANQMRDKLDRWLQERAREARIASTTMSQSGTATGSTSIDAGPAALKSGYDRPPSSQPAGSEAVEATALTQIHRLEAEARWMGEHSHMGSVSLSRMSQRLFDIAAALSATAPADGGGVKSSLLAGGEAGSGGGVAAPSIPGPAACDPADVRRGGLQPDPAELDAIVQEGVERCSVAIRRLIDNPALARTAEGDDV